MRRTRNHHGDESGTANATTSNNANHPKNFASPLPSWCNQLRKEEDPGNNNTAYDERVTTSTRTTEIRLRQESVRCWNKRLEEASSRAFAKFVAPVCAQISTEINVKTNGGGSSGILFDEQQQKTHQDDGDDDDGDDAKSDEDAKADKGENNDDDWDYCQQLFGLSSSASIASATALTGTPSSISIATKSSLLPRLIRYPLEVLPVFVITSPLISNCLQDRLKISHAMWRQLNALPSTIGSNTHFSHRFSSIHELQHEIKHEIDTEAFEDDDEAQQQQRKTICLYLPRLLSSWTETLHLLWDGLLQHFENTHDAPAMDADDPTYYAHPTDLLARRHSYHVSKRRHYERIFDRKVTTESQKHRIGTKKQQSIQDFILEFLTHVYEEPKEFSSSTRNTNTYNNNNSSGYVGNLVVLLEDPRIVHPKVSASSNSEHTTKSNNNNNSRLLQSQLLETLAAWRGLHGIPVSLVVMNIVGGLEQQDNNLLLNPSFAASSGGRFGIRTLRCSIPSSPSSLLLDSSGGSKYTEERHQQQIPPVAAFALWSQHFLEEFKATPMPLLVPPWNSTNSSNINNTAISNANSSSTITESVLKLCQDALQNEASCSSWVEALRARITTSFYSRKGSFVWDALNPHTAQMADLSYSSTLQTAKEGSDGDNNITPIRRENDEPEENAANKRDHDFKKEDKQQQQQQQIQSQSQPHLPFEIGTDEIHLFYPELVAWFCFYPNAHNLLSAEAGDTKSKMTLGDKCEALLRCYELTMPPSKVSSDLSASNSKSKSNHRLTKCQRLPAKVNNGGGKGGGTLQFWWSISCSLLPLRILSLTTNEGILASISVAGRTALDGRQKDSAFKSGQYSYRWVLERLADAYRQLLGVSEEQQQQHNHHGGDQSKGSATSILTPERSLASSTVTTGLDTQQTIANANNDSIKTAAPCNKEDEDKEDETTKRNQDFVEATLRRYLQRGMRKNEIGGSCLNGGGCCVEATDGEKEMVQYHQESIRQLTSMVQELIVLIYKVSAPKKKSNASEDEDDRAIRSNKIRAGIEETILEMNRLVLGQTEMWTRRWIEHNPFMAAQHENEDRIKSDLEKGYGLGNSRIHNNEGRPVNFRRRILDNLPPGSRKLYEALDGRLLVERDDWYRSFGGTVEDFAVGVWTLQTCGLIRPKKTTKLTAASTNKALQQRGNAKRRQETVSYEKVAVVWC